MMLDSLTSTGAVDKQSVVILFVIGLVALVPTYFQKKDKKDQDDD